MAFPVARVSNPWSFAFASRRRPGYRSAKFRHGLETRTTNILAAVVMFVLFCSAPLTTFADAPTSQPIDPALATELATINTKTAAVKSLTADFEQKKSTPMLKKPLVSSGTVASAGGISLWVTAKPQPTSMRVTDQEIRIYYPAQQTVEIYPLAGQLGALAASPLPKLATLEKFFNFERMHTADIDKAATDDACVAVKLTPIDPELAKHVKEVHVLLDRTTGAIRQVDNLDPDGDVTSMTFTHVKLDADLPESALKLDVPAGTREVHPLAGMDAPQ
jgi:outer membrane lipoprotein-sorting protein